VLIPSKTTDRYWLIAINKNHYFRKPKYERESGKWLLFAEWREIDRLWPIIQEALLSGRLGHSVKVATRKENPNAADNETGVICIFTDDFNDTFDVLRVADALRQLGITQKLVYKLDRHVGKYEHRGHRNFPPMLSFSTGMIRPLITADLDAFIALRKRSWADDPLSWDHEPGEAIDPEEWRDRIVESENGSVLFGYFLTEDRAEPELVGLTGMKRFEATKRSHRAMIWGVYVSPVARGRGASKLLLEACIARARKLEGLHHLVLSVSHHAKAALRSYEKVGFTVFGREPAAARTGEVFMDEIHMMLVL